jgi:hypothetical protein
MQAETLAALMRSPARPAAVPGLERSREGKCAKKLHLRPAPLQKRLSAASDHLENPGKVEPAQNKAKKSWLLSFLLRRQ